MVVQIPGVTPSAELREQLAGQTVLLSFSRGKDSLAAWLALRDAGVRVIPFHLYIFPDLQFVQESLDYYAEWFGLDEPIMNLPHPALYRWLADHMFQAPERCAIVEAARLPIYKYDHVNELVRDHYNIPDAWICDGVRATDSPFRRMALKTYGPVNERKHQMKIVWDWRKADVMDAINAAGVKLPEEYEWFGRSFDGIDYRFTAPLKEHRPDDYARILDWFPLIELEVIRGPL